MLLNSFFYMLVGGRMKNEGGWSGEAVVVGVGCEGLGIGTHMWEEEGIAAMKTTGKHSDHDDDDDDIDTTTIVRPLTHSLV